MKPRVLLTGATGLIGRPTLENLQEKGFEVVALSRTAEVPGADETVHCNLLNPSSRRDAVAEAGASHMLHLAWHDAPKDRWHSSMNRIWGEATIALVREFSAAGGKRAVCVGSCAEYDWSQEVLHEDSPLIPGSAYGRAKAETGKELVRIGPELGLSLAWARVFFCYGPGEPKGRLVGDILAGLTAGIPVPCTDGLQERDYLHTSDVAQALALLLESELQGPVNVASGIAIQVRELIETTARKIGHPELVQLGEIARSPKDPARLVADITRLRSIGFSPRYDLDSGVQDCIEKFEQGLQL